MNKIQAVGIGAIVGLSLSISVLYMLKVVLITFIYPPSL